jgi:hypothetical protein
MFTDVAPRQKYDAIFFSFIISRKLFMSLRITFSKSICRDTTLSF